MKYLSFCIVGLSLLAACDEPAHAPDSQVAPSCKDVVARSDRLAVDWAARESQHKADALRKVIENERTAGEEDPAVTACEERLSDDQKRCVMAADDLLAKNECLKP